MWEDAEQKCVEYGGHLTSIQSSEENKFVYDLSEKAVTWIGGNDLAAEGSWTWSDGTPWSFTNWKGQPNNDGNEDCLDIGYYNEEWNDNKCSRKLPAICKKSVRDFARNEFTETTSFEPSTTINTGINMIYLFIMLINHSVSSCTLLNFHIVEVACFEQKLTPPFTYLHLYSFAECL